MVVIDASEVSKYESELSKVILLDKEDAATLYEAWETAVKNESLDWFTVAEVYKSTDGFYYFYSEQVKVNFNIFEFILSHTSSIKGDLNSLTAKAILGKGRGLPSHPRGYREPEIVAPVQNPYLPTSQAPVIAGDMASVVAGNSAHGGSAGVVASVGVPVALGGSDPWNGISEDDEATGILTEDDEILPPAPVRVFVLEIEDSGSLLQIGKAEYTIGRSESASWRILGNKSISRKHAKVWMTDDERLMIQDLNSSNGVYADAKRVSNAPTDVTNARVIAFGNAQVYNKGVQNLEG